MNVTENIPVDSRSPAKTAIFVYFAVHNPSNKTNGNAIAPAAWMSEPPSPETMRAAQVHGQMTSDDFAMRKPQRLESLPPTTKMKRKKSRQQVE